MSLDRRNFFPGFEVGSSRGLDGVRGVERCNSKYSAVLYMAGSKSLVTCPTHYSAVPALTALNRRIWLLSTAAHPARKRLEPY